MVGVIFDGRREKDREHSNKKKYIIGVENQCVQYTIYKEDTESPGRFFCCADQIENAQEL